MNEDKTLDEALDEMDEWGAAVSRAIEGLTPEHVADYFRRARESFEKQMGKKFPTRSAPQPDSSK